MNIFQRIHQDALHRSNYYRVGYSFSYSGSLNMCNSSAWMRRSFTILRSYSKCKKTGDYYGSIFK